MGLPQRLCFLKCYLRNPHVVGALAPSSRALAVALSEPYRRARRPARVLEVGAGTGAITGEIGRILRPDDRLDVCEIQPELADILARDVLTRPEFAPAVAEGRVRLLRSAVQGLDSEDYYDFVISGLPFTAFELADVESVFAVVQRAIKPHGIFSYFEYAGMRKTTRLLAVGRRRERIRAVSSFLNRTIRAHQFAHHVVLQNIPPAHARHLRFHGNGNGHGNGGGTRRARAAS